MTTIADAKRRPCSSCGRPIVMAGCLPYYKSMPLDPEPVEHGNVVDAPSDVTFSLAKSDKRPIVKVLKKDEQSDGPRYVTHFVTCAHAADHRKP